jgi:histidine triad (HIT) family protein
VADCLFCAIAAGEVEAEIVHSDDDHVAFLDIRPVFAGHTLLIPRPHIDTLEELPEEAIGPFFGLGRRLAVAVREGMGSVGTFVAINNRVSQSVPHLHLHVVPRRPKDGLRGFFWPRNPYEGDEQMRAAGAAIRAALDG